MRTLSLPSIVCALACSAFPAARATTAPSTQPTIEQQCESLRAKWADRLRVERMAVIVSPPFVVAGDGGEARLRGYVAHTIRAAADALHQKFFDAPPGEPVLILLFESDEPYRRLAKRWFGDTDVSRFGYFRHDNVMLMNVGTGTGTLVHELTHALIKPDFPDVPSWFNEGLGSLFEQCTLANGDIRGLENWRLPALQRAIRSDTLRPLSELIADDEFYNDARVGLNYAQARYLLMYLQDHGTLPAFYKRFRADHANDPTGLAALKATIAPKSLDELEKGWRAWVLRLTLH
jgi:hypothetical protein